MKPLLPWNSNKYYIFLCVCARTRLCQCVRVHTYVGVGARTLAYTCARIALIIQHATRRHIVILFLPSKWRTLRSSGLKVQFLDAFANCEKWLLASPCPSVRMEQLGSHWTDFDEIWYFRLFLKPVDKVQVSLKSNENNGYFTWRRFDIFDDILLNSY